MAASSLVLFFTTHLVPRFIRAPYFIIIYAVYIIGYTFQTTVVKSGQSVITNDVNQRPLITFFDSTFIMFAHGLTAFYVSVYLLILKIIIRVISPRILNSAIMFRF